MLWEEKAHQLNQSINQSVTEVFVGQPLASPGSAKFSKNLNTKDNNCTIINSSRDICINIGIHDGVFLFEKIIGVKIVKFYMVLLGFLIDAMKQHLIVYKKIFIC